MEADFSDGSWIEITTASIEKVRTEVYELRIRRKSRREIAIHNRQQRANIITHVV
jgi:hypothetical protein